MKIDLKRIKALSVKQQQQSECGVACLFSLTRYYNTTASYNSIKELVGVSKNGTSMLGLFDASQSLGFNTKAYLASIDDIIGHNKPMILHIVTKSNYEHYVIFFGFQNNHFIIWDPASGIIKMSKEDLDKCWVSKKCLALAPDHEVIPKTSRDQGKYKWFISIIKKDSNMLVSATLVGLFISLLGLTMAIFSQKLIDDILDKNKYENLIVLSISAFFLLTSRVLLIALRQFILILQGKNFNIRIVNKFYDSLLFLKKSFFESKKTGDFVARLNDTMRIQTLVNDLVGTYIIDLLICLSSLILLFHYSVITGLFSLVFLPCYLIIVLKWNKEILIKQKNVMENIAYNESNYINTIQGITEIKAFNKQEIFIERNFSIYKNMQDSIFSLKHFKLKLDLLIGVIGVLFVFTVITYNSIKVIDNKISIGQLMAILTIITGLLPSLINLAMLAFPLNESRVAFSRMYDYASLDSETSENCRTYKSKPSEVLSLHNISFRYQGHSELLKDINLKLEKGTIVSLIGESGSGKSTISKIIERFYDPNKGNIRLDGILTTEMCIHEWRKKISLIPQDIHIFDGTILENICLYDITHDYNRAINFLESNSLVEYFNRFSMGLNTVIGESGIELSGGEKQFIAFCRAMYKEPEFLIIDEGTSAVDRDTEIVLLNLIRKIKNNTGVLIITHKFNTVHTLSDYIYVLDKGIISTSGTHNDLINSDNLYRRLWYDIKNLTESNINRL